ncbi:response regulator [Paenibacillus tengchongensis]|uniref:response regulator n=1 Tax=Paenibacillus tengchongensis TaxID=2608684 RepID=UPI001652A78E|nr:response regulator [Paenibacillus tengchongensis]
MLRIVIVDDEVLIREGLARMIAKESGAFRVIGTYQDGKQLLEELPFLQADVVITDIRMPQIDGLELIRELKASYPHIRSLLMSGFVEFEYAREAIRSSAVDYLLKPINKEQLFEVLYNLEREQEERLQKAGCQRTGLLLSLLQLEEPSAVLLNGLSLPQPFYTVYAIKGYPAEEICSRVDGFLQSERPGAEWPADDLGIQKGQHILIRYSAHLLSAEEIQAFAGRLAAACAGLSLHLGASRCCSEPARLRAAYLEARQACDSGIHQAGPQVVAVPSSCPPANIPGGNPAAHAADGSTDPVAPFREMLIHDLQILNVSGVLETVQRIFAELQTRLAGPEAVLRACRRIEELAVQELAEFPSFYRQEPGRTLEDELDSCMSFAGMKELFMQPLADALERLRTHRLRLSGTAVEAVKRWIADNYRQHYDLNMLAGLVFLTPSYLSKLFKQETGLTLTDYITEIRIREAKHLLKQAPDLKVHEIGAEVGYPDPAYFNKLFKKIVGVTPSEYKRITLV